MIESANESQEPELPQVRERSGGFWPLLGLLVVAGAVLIGLQARRPEPVSQWVGRALPPLDAGGWLNTDKPLTADDLRGKVVLVDFWTTTCGYCLRHMPEIAEFHQRFGERGVLVVGLTPEPAQAVERVKQVVEVAGIDWPIGYGAGVAFNALGIFGTPTYVLYDRTGRSVWGGHSLDGLEDAAVAALAKN
ncbi:MAG: redoxin family protein [Pirellulales bacterium]